jgi:acetyltransferase-like isoleucine patch superfamily enzyme
MGDDGVLGDGVLTTGSCSIGHNVNIRTGAIISKCVYIEDNVFIGPGVITNHTKHVMGPKAESEKLITLIMRGSVIGSGAHLNAGVTIGENVTVGAGTVVTKDLLEEGTYVGNPARKLK